LLPCPALRAHDGPWVCSSVATLLGCVTKILDSFGPVLVLVGRCVPLQYGTQPNTKGKGEVRGKNRDPGRTST
jgi:hypothetical protein